MEEKKTTAMKSSLPPFWEHFKQHHESSETRVEESAGAYRNLPFEALYSSFDDLTSIFNHPSVSGTFVDLGCGAGQSVLLYSWMFPDRKGIGVEFQKARLNHGIGLENAELIHADLLDCKIPECETYFVYFPTGPVLDRILSELYRMGHDFVLIAIESHGHLLPRLDLENWLVKETEIPLSSKRHYHFARIYRRVHIPRDKILEPFLHTFKEHYLLLQDNWIGETFGMEWQEGDRFELMTPPRTISWKDVKKLMVLEEIPPRFHEALRIRRLGELEITLRTKKYSGFIRKIMIDPSFVVEISSGEKVEWSEIQTIYQGSTLCYASSFRS